jgi:hypothetical protein
VNQINEFIISGKSVIRKLPPDIRLKFKDELKEINKFLSNCGCSIGAISLLGFIVVYLLCHIFFANFTSIKLSTFAFHSFVVALIGKFVGILFYRIKATVLYCRLLTKI